MLLNNMKVYTCPKFIKNVQRLKQKNTYVSSTIIPEIYPISGDYNINAGNLKEIPV